MSQLILQTTATISSQITHTRPNPLPGPAPMSMQLRAAAITSQLVTTSDNLLPASTLDMSPPLSVVTITQSIQIIDCTTLPLQNSPIIAHGQQLSFVQQIPVPTSQALHYHCFQLPAIHKIFHYHHSCYKPSSECPISVHTTLPLTELHITTNTRATVAADTAR